MKPIVLFRCDASPTIGGGHVMRCLALAEQMIAVGYRPVFVTTPESAYTVPALAASGIAIVPTAAHADGADAAVAHGLGEVACAVIDHYGLGAAAENTWKAVARRVIAFEDMPCRAHAADVLVDPTPARQGVYSSLVPAHTRLLLGPAHAMIARRWRDARKRQGVDGDARGDRRRIVVSMGATDPVGATGRVLDAVAEAGIDAAIVVVIGANAPQLSSLRTRCAAADLYVDPPDLPAIIGAADLVIGAPGSSAFERALLGIPSLLIPIADNQVDIAAAFASAGAAEVVPAAILDEPAVLGALIAALLADDARRLTMAAMARAFCDGRGTQRLLCALAGEVVMAGAEIALRLAEDADVDVLFDLQSDSTTRRFARNPAVPTRSEHEAWLARCLVDPDRQLMIVTDHQAPVGMVRLDRAGQAEAMFEVSIGIARAARGKGYGAAALALVRRVAPGASLEATVFPANEASVALFRGAGYVRSGEASYRSLPQ